MHVLNNIWLLRVSYLDIGMIYTVGMGDIFSVRVGAYVLQPLSIKTEQGAFKSKALDKPVPINAQ